MIVPETAPLGAVVTSRKSTLCASSCVLISSWAITVGANAAMNSSVTAEAIHINDLFMGTSRQELERARLPSSKIIATALTPAASVYLPIEGAPIGLRLGWGKAQRSRQISRRAISCRLIEARGDTMEGADAPSKRRTEEVMKANRLEVLKNILTQERTNAMARLRELRRSQGDESAGSPGDEMDVARSLTDVETNASLEI